MRLSSGKISIALVTAPLRLGLCYSRSNFLTHSLEHLFQITRPRLGVVSWLHRQDQEDFQHQPVSLVVNAKVAHRSPAPPPRRVEVSRSLDADPIFHAYYYGAQLIGATQA
jgi:hypothetical protein